MVKGGRLINMSTFSYTFKKYSLPLEHNIMVKKKYPGAAQSNKFIEARYFLTVGKQRLILVMVSF
jgi:hypothetical protein